MKIISPALVSAIKCVVEDTIGAGDSYMAALIHGLLFGGTGGMALPFGTGDACP